MPNCESPYIMTCQGTVPSLPFTLRVAFAVPSLKNSRIAPSCCPSVTTQLPTMSVGTLLTNRNSYTKTVMPADPRHRSARNQELYRAVEGAESLCCCVSFTDHSYNGDRGLFFC